MYAQFRVLLLVSLIQPPHCHNTHSAFTQEWFIRAHSALRSGCFSCMCWSVCHRYKVAVKMTLYASDGFKPWWLWVNVWRVHAENGFCLEGEKNNKKTAFQPLSGSWQNGTNHLPLLSYQCGVNCLSGGEKKQGMGLAGGCLFVGFFIFY